MVIRVTLKDPDTMHDAVDAAMADQPVPEGVHPDEWDVIREERASQIKRAISAKFMEWGEYLIVDFSVTIDGKATEAIWAKVVPYRDAK